VRIFQLASRGVVALCGLYLATIVYGMGAGDALPSSTVFRLVGSPLLTTGATWIPYAMLAFAAVGAALAWVARFRFASRHGLRGTELALFRSWRVWGLPVIACLLLFALSAGGWSGHISSVDLNYLSLAGLIPHSDAGNYVSDAFRQALWGEWGTPGSRRPLGEAFRELTILAAQYSYVSMLLVQLALLAIMLYFAACRLARWRGIWAACAFVGFIFILERPFLSTTMTEPLGMFWALFALVFFIEAIERHSLPHALIGLAALTAALLTRMGSLFTIPVLTIWIGLAFGTTLAQRIRVFAAASVVVLLVVAFNMALGRLYGSPQTVSGANFAFTLCGMSLGSDWSECSRLYATQLSQLPDERAQGWFLISQTWDHILRQPGAFVARLAGNVAKLALSQPRYFVTGFGPMDAWTKVAAGLAMLALLPGLLFAWRRRFRSTERWFWLAMIASIALSAALTFADDGWRIMHVTHAFEASLLAMAFAAPRVVVVHRVRPMRWRVGAAMVVGMAVLLLLAPMLSRQQMRRAVAAHAPIGAAGANEHIVLGGRGLTGFLVVSDAAARPTDIPALHTAEFAQLIKVTGLEPELRQLMGAVAGSGPFAVVFAPRLDRPDGPRIYFAPPRVLEETGAWAWRLTTRSQLLPDETGVFLAAVAAQPLP
jgi:hypothetical protein